jgi:hypothetical protein
MNPPGVFRPSVSWSPYKHTHPNAYVLAYCVNSNSRGEMMAGLFALLMSFIRYVLNPSEDAHPLRKPKGRDRQQRDMLDFFFRDAFV